MVLMVLESVVRPTVDEESNVAHWLLDCRVVVHPLLFCPAIPKGTRYCLASRDELGRRAMLGLGMTLNAHGPLNLAVVRRRGASLGANEVLVLEPLAPVTVIEAFAAAKSMETPVAATPLGARRYGPRRIELMPR
jgi:hypothetical protein